MNFRNLYPVDLLRTFLGKAFTVLVINLLSVSLGFGVSDTDLKSEETEDDTKEIQLQKVYGGVPLYFIRNEGQLDKRVKFYEKGREHTTFFTQEGVYLLLTGLSTLHSKFESQKERLRGSHQRAGKRDKHFAGTQKFELIKLTPLDAKKDTKIIADKLQKGKVNYFVGSDKKKWRSNISTFNAVLYKNIYDGIDIKFYGNNRQLQYDIIVKPGADLSKMKFSYTGIKGLKVAKDGDLEIVLKNGKIIQKKPYIYQIMEHSEVAVEGKFRTYNSDLVASDTQAATHNLQSLTHDLDSEVQTQQFIYSFEVASYDKDRALIIDPVILYSTYLGGIQSDDGYGVAVDVSGNAYITGLTFSDDFPTVSAYQWSKAAYSDIFVTKIDPEGTSLIYSTFIGGKSYDQSYSIDVDDSGNAYITGLTSSSDFPTVSAYQGSYAGLVDAFVTKIDTSGSSLVYSTYLGGSDHDDGLGISLEDSANAVITGETFSTDFPTVNALQGICKGCPQHGDAFVTKMDAQGSILSFSTFLGGSRDDYGQAIASDSSGNHYVTGMTSSTDFPTVSAYQGTHAGGYSDAFVTKIDSMGSALMYSTYLGGSDNEGCWSIAVNDSGSAYVTGGTTSTDFPTAFPVQESYSGEVDAIVTNIDASGSSLTYSTYLGGSDYDFGWGITADDSGNAYITGETSSTDFPTFNPIQGANAGGQDAFVTKIAPGGVSISYSTYLGGGGYVTTDIGRGIAIDRSKNVYVTGETWSTEFPTVNPIQGTNAGFSDAFVVKISTVFEDITHTFTSILNDAAPPGGFIGPFTVEATNNSTSYYAFAVSRYIINPDGTTVNWPPVVSGLSGGETRTHSHIIIVPIWSQKGIYTAGVILTDTNGNEIDHDTFNFTVISSAFSHALEGSLTERLSKRDEEQGWRFMTLKK